MAKRDPLPRPVALKEVLQRLLKPHDWDALEQRRQVRRVWEAALPAHLLAQTRLVDIRRKELWVEVGSGAHGQELQFLKPRILEELAKALGPGVIRDLRFLVGEGF
jgi:predicted nucleic acid-binding Zn ribbon protein